MKIVLPKTECRIDPTYGPLFYLAGPVRGGDDWQKKCCEEIQKIQPHFYAAIPYYHTREVYFPLMDQAIEGVPDAFLSQLNWERHYMDYAAAKEKGCIIFWLPEESKVNPRPPGSGPYAMDTRGELGEWRGRMIYDQTIRVVVGAEEGFPGLSQIKRNFDAALDRDFPIFPTLKETVEAALILAQ
jgi:hypothetical protein